jgi:hypothetical protein
VTVNDAEDDGDEDQRRDRSKNEAADDGAAKGAFCSPPSPTPSAIGSMPMIMASAVITHGAEADKPASSAAAVASPSSEQPLAGEGDDQHRVGRRHAHAHDGPVSAGTESVVLVANSIQTMPASAAGGR